MKASDVMSVDISYIGTENLSAIEVATRIEYGGIEEELQDIRWRQMF
jgi:hypothetical protein